MSALAGLQKCEVAQRPRAANGAEHRSTAEQLALATGAAAYRWEDPTKAPVSPSMLLNPRRYGDGAKDLFITLNCVQENIIRGGQRDRSRRRPDGSRMPKSRAIKGIDEDIKLNKALWETAEVFRNGWAQ